MKNRVCLGRTLVTQQLAFYLANSPCRDYSRRSMKVVIVGAGTLGLQIARELAAENRDVVVLEQNPDIAKGIANELDCLVIVGNGENLDDLSETGLEDTDWFIALTGSDNANIVACGLVAETFSRPKTIARVRSPYFTSLQSRKRRILGVDYILNPEAETAQAVARLIFRGMSTEIIDVKEAGIQLRKLRASEDSRFPGKSLSEVRSSIGRDFMVPAVIRQGELHIPSGNYTFESIDVVFLLGEPKELDRLFGRSSRSSLKLRRILQFGAGALGRQVLRELGVPVSDKGSTRRKIKEKMPNALSLLGNPTIKVIDENKDAAKQVANEFSDIEVVCRDLSDELIIEEEGVGRADVALCLTESQSVNLVTALTAKKSGASRALAVVYNDLYMRLEGLVDIDDLVSQKSVVAGAILDIVRKANIRRLHNFAEGRFELVELSIGINYAKAGYPIVDLGIPRGILVAFVIHESRTIIPTGDTVIQPKDIVGLVLSKEQISRLETLFGA